MKLGSGCLQRSSTTQVPAAAAQAAVAAAALTVPRRQPPLLLLALLLPPLLLARSPLRQGHGGCNGEALRASCRSPREGWGAEQLREGGPACTRQPVPHGAAQACGGASKLKVFAGRQRIACELADTEGAAAMKPDADDGLRSLQAEAIETIWLERQLASAIKVVRGQLEVCRPFG